MDAVAPPAIETLPGWLLPFDTTSFGRAISAIPTGHQGMDTTLIGEIEARYQQRGSRVQFRIADVAGLQQVCDSLRERGYTPQQPTLTMAGNIPDWPKTRQGLTAHLSDQPTRDWSSVYLSEEFGPVDGANRVQALSRGQCLVYAWLIHESGAIAAGTASFRQGWASLHGMHTVARVSGRGHASTLMAALGAVALEINIQRCFLQVEEDNARATQFYRRFGFRTAWRYHCWRRPSQAATE